MFSVTFCHCGITCSRQWPTQTSRFATIPPEASLVFLYVGYPGGLHRISTAYLIYFCLCSLCQFHYKHAYLYDTCQYAFWDVMLCQCTSCFLMFWRITVPMPVGSSSPRNLGLLHPDHEGTTVLKNGEPLGQQCTVMSQKTWESSEYQIKKLEFLTWLNETHFQD
jgi:hypothetical protein